MPERDTASQPFHDLLSAFGLLSRIPLPQTTKHRPEAAWTWPIVGLVVGSLSVLPGIALLHLGASATTSAAFIVIFGLLITGAMHEDGLADSADGLFGGWTPERRLEIMKDSHIGSYGTLALISVLLALWSSYTALLGAGEWPAILAASALSRAAMAVLMTLMPNARRSGLSATVGRPRIWAAGVAVVLAIALSVLVLGDFLILTKMIAGTGLAAVAVALLANAKIGGQTGDILGATQQVALLLALVAAQI